MDLNLTKDDREVQARAREFVENHLFPCELECEENDGLSQNSLAAIRKAAVEYKVVAMNHARKDWCTDARLHIAAHCVGAATRATEVANDYAAGRVQFGKPIRDFQAIEFMLADMAVEIMAAKSMVYRACREIAQRMDRKLVHAHASAVKLYASEMAGRVVDKAVQSLGGRGYMRENPVERLYRDMRVERIWEGTSEIQRTIIGNQIKKRGLEVYTGWPGPAGN